MTLLERIQEEMKQSLRDKNQDKLKALRSAITVIKNEEIARRPAEFSEADAENALKKEVKKLKDSIVELRAGGREDMAEDYQKEVDVLSQYLPEELGEESIRDVAEKILPTLEDKSFGSVMKAVMAEVKGRADGGVVSKVVKGLLG